jgi:hypothetical protein
VMLWKLSKTDQLREIPETTVFVRIDAHVVSGECKGGGGGGGGGVINPTIRNYLKCPFRIPYTIIRLCIESARVTNKLIACQSGSPMSIHVCVNIHLSIICLGVYIQINEINMTCDFFYTFTRL